MSRHPKGCGARESRTRRPRLRGGIGYDEVIADGVVQCRCQVCEAVVLPKNWPLHGSSVDPHRTLAS